MSVVTAYPKNWQVTNLAGTATLNYGKGLPETTRSSGGVPVYGSSGIAGYHNKPLIQEEGYIIGRKGTVGAVYYSPEPFYPIDTVYYSAKSDVKCNFKFFYYLLKTLKLGKLNSDSAVPGLNRDTAYAQQVLLPPLTEQEKIAAILSVLDDKIALNNKISAVLEQMAQEIFKEKVSKVVNGKEFNLLQIAKYVNGGAFGKIINRSGRGIPLIKIAELNRGITDNTEWINQPVDGRYYVGAGDLLFSWSGTVGVFIWDKGRSVLNQHIFNVVPNPGFSRGFLYLVLKSKLRFFQQIAGSKATTMGHIKKEHLKEQRIFIPRDVNVAIFDSIYQKLVGLKLENQKLSALRDLLLPKLMSGEIRV